MVPAWGSRLRELYWWLRYQRRTGQKHKYWRQIAAERRVLLAQGVPAIEIHLYCRLLANPHLQSSRRRWESYIRLRDAGASPWFSGQVQASETAIIGIMS